MVQYLVLGRTVHAHILRRAVVRDFIIEGGKLRHFDEVAETLLLDHIVRHVKFKIRRLLGKYRRPSVETPYVLPFQLLRRRYLNSRYNSVSELLIVVPERKVAPKSFPVRSCMVRMAKSMLSAFWLPSLFPIPPHGRGGVESQILELVALIYEDVVDAHRLKSTSRPCVTLWRVPPSPASLQGCACASPLLSASPATRIFPCCRSTSRFSSTVSSSACRWLLQFVRLRYLAETGRAVHDDAIVVVVLIYY